MSGALIVEGGLDDIPQIKAAQEKVMVQQQFMFAKDSDTTGQVSKEAVYEGAEIVTAINGVSREEVRISSVRLQPLGAAEN